jgi:NAD(P)-dependent dehydrogenase (short-subunit alcohol dehydrogenase family)
VDNHLVINSLMDSLMDRTVIAGFSNVGYRVRSHAWKASDLAPMDSQIVLVTGANSGLGFAAAEGFARLGATVWLAVRNAERGDDARARIEESTGSGAVHVGICDLSRLESVREFAARFSAEAGRLDVLVNNAGVLTEQREVSADGIEMTFATNVVGPFLLTGLLAPLLEASAPSRVINVSSGGMYTQKLAADDLQFERGTFDGTTAYARTKRAQVVLTELWAQRLQRVGVVVHSMHPGWADTPGLRASLPRFYRATQFLLRTPEQGADTIVWLGAAPEPAQRSGGFWHDRRERSTHMVPRTTESPADRDELWAQCVWLSGLDLGLVSPAASASD